MNSIQEALLLTVWLRRQELEVRKVAVIAMTANPENTKNLSEAYKQFVDSAFPFAVSHRGASDQQLIAEMKKEADKGRIEFTPIATPSPLQKTAARMRLPDDFKEKMQQKRARRR